MHYKISLSNEANKDMDKISKYLKNFEANRDIIIKKIDKDINNLCFMPRIHKTIFYYTNPEMECRRMISGKYSVIYKIIDDEIIILRIFNQKQNYLNHKNFILKEKSPKYIITK